MKVTLTSSDALGVAWDAKQYMVQPPGQGGTGLLPGGVRDWLAALRLTEGVPFQHLVVDDRLLPPESIRFFYLDRNWTDALVAGALSVSAITTDDRAQLQALYPQIRDELDAAERLVRVPGNEVGAEGPADVVTGLLIRSRAVSGWPAMHVRAYRTEVPDNGPDDEASPAAPDAPGTPRPAGAARPLRRRARGRAPGGAAVRTPVRLRAHRPAAARRNRL